MTFLWTPAYRADHAILGRAMKKRRAEMYVKKCKLDINFYTILVGKLLNIDRCIVHSL